MEHNRVFGAKNKVGKALSENRAKEETEMKSAGMSFVKVMGTGIAAGMLVAAVGGTMMNNRKNVKKTAGKAAKMVSNILDDVQYMLK